MDKNCAIIVAGGKGKRMHKNVNKLFLEVNEKPILAYTLEAFQRNKNIDNIILVAAFDDIHFCEKIIEKYAIHKLSKIVCGGEERQQSVLNGLNAIDNCQVVLIHDGARPFVSSEIIDKGIEYANIYGAAACGVEPKDTIKVKDFNGFSQTTLNRSDLVCIQTPQCFKFQLIKDAHIHAVQNSIFATDDTMLIEKLNKRVFLYEGSYNNIKITTPEDIIIGEEIVHSLLT